MRSKPERLFHYTCSHGALDIRREGELECAATVISRQFPEKKVGEPQAFVVWLTDMEPPAHREALGLTMHETACDRIRYCFEVVPDWGRMEWYMTFRKRHPELRNLEREGGSMPAHWYVGRGPVPVLREVEARA